MNHIRFNNDENMDLNLFPDFIPKSEVSQIKSKISQWTSKLNDIIKNEIKSILEDKPLYPIWISHHSTYNDNYNINEKYKVILVSASDHQKANQRLYCHISKSSYIYVQGN